MSNQILADIQFLGNRIVKLNLETNLINSREKADTSFDFDFGIKYFDETDENYNGVIQLIVKAKSTIKKKALFKIELITEGAFIGNANAISKETFIQLMERNGLITLLHISRSYLIGVTAQSGINPPVKMPMINVLKLIEQKKAEQNANN